MVKTINEYADKFRTIRIRVEDYNFLLGISEQTQIPIVGLIHLAIPMLKKKYKIKDEPKINDIIEGQIELRCDNGDSKL